MIVKTFKYKGDWLKYCRWIKRMYPDTDYNLIDVYDRMYERQYTGIIEQGIK